MEVQNHIKIRPIILLISERSGSNLLRTLLGNHKCIEAPVAPHLIKEFYPIRNYYGNLNNRTNYRNLVNDMLSIANHPYHGWNLDIQQIKTSPLKPSVVGAFDSLYRSKADLNEAIYYCSKETEIFNYIDTIRAELPEAQFVHLVRDPRDHVASWMKRPMNKFTPYDIVQKWIKEQELFIDAIESKGLKCISIKYEDLIEDVPKVMSNILEFLGIDIDDNCFRTDVNNEESERNPYWKNLSKPVISSNKNKFKEELNEEDIYIIETLAETPMRFFNYPLTTDCNWAPNDSFFTNILSRRKELKHSMSKKNDQSRKYLDDRIRLRDEIYENRYRHWESTGLNKKKMIKQINRRIKNTNKPKPNFLVARLRYFCIAILGNRITNKIFR